MRDWRVNSILFLLFLFGVAIISRLFFLQVMQNDFYSALARGQQNFFVKTQGERGKIFFQNHDLPLASTKINYFLYASPPEIPQEQKEKTAEIVSGIIGQDKLLIHENLQEDSLYELIKDRLSENEADELNAQKLSGIYIGKENQRDYPYGAFASHILGFVNKDGQGQYGVEEYWDDFLKGKENTLQGERGPLGYFFSSRENEPSDGSDLTLTVDYNIQYVAEKLLADAKNDLDIDGGTIIVIKPRTGEIIVLADFPNFDPNKYYQEKNLEIFQTDATQKVFEPGSVFKPITMAGALNEGKISPQTIYQDPGVVEVGGWPIYNYDKRVYPGDITMTEVLEKSINTGAVFAESKLGHEGFMDYIEKFGIFNKTGLDLAGEALPLNKELKEEREANFATASFGQGIEMTPIQLVKAFSAIANGGKLVNPYLAKGADKSDAENIISLETASKLTAMLVSVVENGFGKAAKVPGYFIAGKTGTAQISFSSLGIEKSGYSDKTWQSFIGFAPAFAPEFLILVKLNDPAARTAEYSAVPIFRELAKYIIDYWQIPPDYNVQ